jgi:hypothetical protein
VHLFKDADVLEAYLQALSDEEHPADGLWLLQERAPPQCRSADVGCSQ